MLCRSCITRSWADAADAKHEYAVTLMELGALQPADAIVLAVAHDLYVEGGWPLIRRLLAKDGASCWT
jgi:UDP-N-acetyl-D-glucosamine/UDP-N-acetyl-D-galactosamine dehydrogenase